MPNAQGCRRQAAECARLSRTTLTASSMTILRNMAKSWTTLANQIDLLAETDPAAADRLLARRRPSPAPTQPVPSTSPWHPDA
jgi:hypothetical protein